MCAVDQAGQRGEAFSELHSSGPTSRALLERLTGEGLIKRLAVDWQGLIGRSRTGSSAQEGPAEGQLVAAAAIGQESELTEALEATWEHMQQEATDELSSRKSHGALLIFAGVVFPTKGKVAVLECEQAMVGDGHAVGVAAQISQDLLWSTKGRLGVDDPLFGSQRSQERIEVARVREVRQGAMKGEFAKVESVVQCLEKETAEQPGEHVNGKKEALATTNPVSTIG